MEPERPSETRNRIALTLPSTLDGVLEGISETLGVPKTSLAIQAIIASLPGWLEQSETIKRAAKPKPKPGQSKTRR
jgi:hypothetical protein